MEASGVVVTRTSGSVVLTWRQPLGPPDNVTYAVLRDGVSGTGALSGTTYTEIGLVTGQTHRYEVYAVNENGRRGSPVAVNVVVA